MIGDFGVLPPDWEVKGEGGGLSSLPWPEGGFILRSSTGLASCVLMLMGEEVSADVPMPGAARDNSLAHVTMSVFSSEGRGTLPPGCTCVRVLYVCACTNVCVCVCVHVLYVCACTNVCVCVCMYVDDRRDFSVIT